MQVEVERIVNLPQGTLIRTIMKEEIHVEDMLTLCPKKWLNDVVSPVVHRPSNTIYVWLSTHLSFHSR